MVGAGLFVCCCGRLRAQHVVMFAQCVYLCLCVCVCVCVCVCMRIGSCVCVIKLAGVGLCVSARPLFSFVRVPHDYIMIILCAQFTGKTPPQPVPPNFLTLIHLHNLHVMCTHMYIFLSCVLTCTFFFGVS